MFLRTKKKFYLPCPCPHPASPRRTTVTVFFYKVKQLYQNVYVPARASSSFDSLSTPTSSLTLQNARCPHTSFDSCPIVTRSSFDGFSELGPLTSNQGRIVTRGHQRALSVILEKINLGRYGQQNLFNPANEERELDEREFFLEGCDLQTELYEVTPE